MTLREYRLHVKAQEYIEADKLLRIHQLAWANRKAEYANEKGEYVFKDFEDFFDYEKVLSKIDNTAKKLTKDQKRLIQIAEIQAKYERKE